MKRRAEKHCTAMCSEACCSIVMQVGKERTTLMFCHDGEIIVVENVPVWECEVCGEKTFEADVVRRVQETVWNGPAPTRFVQARLYDFAA